ACGSGPSAERRRVDRSIRRLSCASIRRSASHLEIEDRVRQGIERARLEPVQLVEGLVTMEKARVLKYAPGDRPLSPAPEPPRALPLALRPARGADQRSRLIRSIAPSIPSEVPKPDAAIGGGLLDLSSDRGGARCAGSRSGRRDGRPDRKGRTGLDC